MCYLFCLCFRSLFRDFHVVSYVVLRNYYSSFFTKASRGGHDRPDEDVIKYAVSASEDANFKNYVYYLSLLKLKKLSGEPFKELRDIIGIEDLEEGVKQFNKWLKNDANMKRLLGVFPFLITD